MKGEVGKAVRLALQYGYRHIDCAQAYGNEDEIGEVLTEVFKEGKLKREDVFITSKLWYVFIHVRRSRVPCSVQDCVSISALCQSVSLVIVCC